MTFKPWDYIQDLAAYIQHRFATVGTEQPLDSDYNWHNHIYFNTRFRRAHIEIVDHRESHGMYILHSTVFPHFNDPSPIWGFDAVCGENKITGAFHDFSSGGDPQHHMMQWFENRVSNISWSKPRELPEWAQAIFSKNMVAAGNIRSLSEVSELCDLASSSLDYYLEQVGITQESGFDYHQAQNRYCHYQKQNPHVIRSMVSMGIPETIMHKFVQEVLFPEVA